MGLEYLLNLPATHRGFYLYFSDVLPSRQGHRNGLPAAFRPVFLLIHLGLLENALSNTLQFIKQESTNDSYTSEEKREMKKDAVEFRNLQAKLAHFLKGVVSVK